MQEIRKIIEVVPKKSQATEVISWDFYYAVPKNTITMYFSRHIHPLEQIVITKLPECK